MNHTPTLTNALITCDCCAFRAVLARDGRAIVTVAGDASVDHLASVAEQRDRARQIIDRLRQRPLDPAQLARLAYCVETEFVL
jgi:hypothetical protein